MDSEPVNAVIRSVLHSRLAIVITIASACRSLTLMHAG